MCCVDYECDDEQCWWVHWLCNINILCHASAERWELLASGLMSITPPRSVKEGRKKHSHLHCRGCFNNYNCKGTSSMLFPGKRQTDCLRHHSESDSIHLESSTQRGFDWQSHCLVSERLLLWCPVPVIKDLFKTGSITLIVEFRFKIQHFPPIPLSNTYAYFCMYTNARMRWMHMCMLTHSKEPISPLRPTFKANFDIKQAQWFSSHWFYMKHCFYFWVRKATVRLYFSQLQLYLI